MLLLGILSLWIWTATAHADFVSGSTGSLGAFSPISTAKRVTLPPGGVLNYTTINIPSNVTVTFVKNAANDPVYMLAQGDVTIAGTIKVDGTDATATDIGKGGPGGFNGGYRGPQTGGDAGKGQGPGGGQQGIYLLRGCGGGGGGFGTAGGKGYSSDAYGWWYEAVNGGDAYGSITVFPLIGGSGGGGAATNSENNTQSTSCGGGGGGAIVIASSTKITVTGSITANGGKGGNGTSNGGGGGSGGAIRLISDIIDGNGTITATGGTGYNKGGTGGAGRIRLEATTNNRTAVTTPDYTFGPPGNVFAANVPSLTIDSIAGYAAPASPTGNYSQPDISLPSTTPNPVTVNITAHNIPVSTAVVKVWSIPQFGAATSYPATLTGTDQTSTAAVGNVSLSTTYPNVVTAEATFTIQQAMNYNGEEIDKVRVVATMGGKSETTYITKSGKEIKGELVAALVK